MGKRVDYITKRNEVKKEMFQKGKNHRTEKVVDLSPKSAVSD